MSTVHFVHGPYSICALCAWFIFDRCLGQCTVAGLFTEHPPRQGLAAVKASCVLFFSVIFYSFKIIFNAFWFMFFVCFDSLCLCPAFASEVESITILDKAYFVCENCLRRRVVVSYTIIFITVTNRASISSDI